MDHACGEGADLVRQHMQVLFEGTCRTLNMEFPIVARNGDRRHWSFSASSPGKLYDGQRFIVGMAVDITERKAAEERQTLLMAELNHRVKNTLATVQSIANQTLRGATDPRQFVETFKARPQALSRAHNLLTRHSWESADIIDVVRDQVTMDGDAERIRLDGQPALLTPQSAVALSLVLHELGTNARKYGALSIPTGRLSVQWHVERAQRVLQIAWDETTGPLVRNPGRRGFGTTLIEKSLGGVGGSAELHFDSAGLRCKICVPLSRKDRRSSSSSEEL